MYELAWLEFDRSGRTVTKTKAFKTEAERTKYVEKLYKNESFHGIYGTRDPE